jgi:hypothetical protein
MNPHEEAPHFRRRQGRVSEHLVRIQQLGRYAGWLRVDGQRFQLDPDRCWGQRDHSWGIRAEMQTDVTRGPLTFYPPLFYTWTTAQFPQHGLQWYFNERAPGDPIYLTGEEVLPLGQVARRERWIASIGHDVAWAADPLGQTIERATFELRFASGASRRVEVRALPGRFFLKGGLYGGLRGWAFGDDRGPLYVEHDRWDLTDPDTRRLARTLSDHVIEVRDGDAVGYGIMEYGVSPGYPRYASVQQHPVF